MITPDYRCGQSASVSSDTAGKMAAHHEWMIDWKSTLGEGLVAGTLAGLLSAAVLLARGKSDSGSAVAPINAESQWLWGEEALLEDRPTLKHTLAGWLTHQASTVFWATLYALVRGDKLAPRGASTALLGGLATSAAAAAIDYGVVPKPLQPGFEQRLSKPSTVGVFAAIAAGVALGAWAMNRDR
jgi:hypothetical protein